MARPDFIRTLVALSWCLLAAGLSSGCDQSQPLGDAGRLNAKIDGLSHRIDKLEDSRPHDLGSGPPAQVEVNVDNTIGVFTNATHVVATGHQIVIDCGTHNGEAAKATSRLTVYLSQYSAKRMQAALAMSVQRHVEVFGDIAPSRSVGRPVPHSANEVMYANFVRITGTSEELILDLGLNPQPAGVPKDPIRITHSVIMDFHSARTFLSQITEVLAAYESRHGPIETDIEKRIVQ